MIIDKAATTPGPYSYLLVKAAASLALAATKSVDLALKIDN